MINISTPLIGRISVPFNQLKTGLKGLDETERKDFSNMLSFDIQRIFPDKTFSFSIEWKPVFMGLYV